MTASEVASPLVRLVHVTTVPQSLAFLRGQVQWMAREGFDVVAVSSPGPMLDAFAAETGTSVRGVLIHRRIAPWNDVVSLFRLIALFWRTRPDIVHAHTPKAGLLAMLASRLIRVPVRIYHVHGLPLDTARGFKRKLLLITEWLACASSTRVAAVSSSLKRSLVQQRICRDGKIVVFGSGSANGIDALGTFNPKTANSRVNDLRDKVGLPHDSLVLGYVGRIVGDKGLCELDQSWQELRKDFPRLHLVLVGPLEDGDPVPPDLVDGWVSDSRVHMCGWSDDVAAWYGLMTVLAFPSHREGFGLAVAEAGAMEVPVVATRVTGVVDAVEDRGTGRLVALGDVPEMTAAIAAYLNDPDLRRRHGIAARQRVLELFRPEEIWKEVKTEYTIALQCAK